MLKSLVSAAVALSFVAGSALAQTPTVPVATTDCTTIQDPAKKAECEKQATDQQNNDAATSNK